MNKNFIHILMITTLFCSTLSFCMSSDNQLVFKQDGELITGCGLKLTDEQGNRRNVLLSPTDIEKCIEKFNVLKTTREYTQKWNKKNNLDFSQSEYLSYETWQHVIKPLCDCSDNTQKLEAFLQQYEHKDLHKLFLLVNHLEAPDLEEKVLSHMIQRLKHDPAWIETYFQKSASEDESNLLPLISGIIQEKPELKVCLEQLIPLRLQTYEKKYTLDINNDFFFYTPRYPNLLMYSPDTIHVASGVNDTVYICNTENGQLVKQLHPHIGQIISIAYNQNGSQLVAGSFNTIIIWDVDTEKIIQKVNTNKIEPIYINYHKQNIMWGRTRVNHDGSLKATSNKGRVIVQDVTTQKDLWSYSGHKIDSYILHLAFSPDNNKIASASTDATVMVCAVPTGKLLHRLTGHPHLVVCLAFSSDNKLASGSDQEIIIWNTETGQKLQSILLESPIGSLAFSLDNKKLASRSKGKMIIWDISSAFLCANLEQILLGRYFIKHKNRILAQSYGKTVFNTLSDAQRKTLMNLNSNCSILG